MNEPKIAHLYGIDPGLSKPWAGYCCSFDLAANQLLGPPTFRSWPRSKLAGLICEMKEKAGDESVVLVSLDVPLSSPKTLTPSSCSTSSRHYPFKVEPFTTCLLYTSDAADE